MRNTLKAIAIMMLVLATTYTLAGKPVQTFNTPMAAAKHDKNVTMNLRKYLRADFVLIDEYEYAYRYFAPPEGDYLWGECVFNLKHEVGGYSLEVTHVQMTAYIDYLEAPNGFACSGFDLIEETVY